MSMLPFDEASAEAVVGHGRAGSSCRSTGAETELIHLELGHTLIDLRPGLRAHLAYRVAPGIGGIPGLELDFPDPVARPRPAAQHERLAAMAFCFDHPLFSRWAAISCCRL